MPRNEICVRPTTTNHVATDHVLVHIDKITSESSPGTYFSAGEVKGMWQGPGRYIVKQTILKLVHLFEDGLRQPILFSIQWHIIRTCCVKIISRLIEVIYWYLMLLQDRDESLCSIWISIIIEHIALDAITTR